MIIYICMIDCIKISLIAPPFSINSYYYRNRKRTKEARQWGVSIHEQLFEYSNAIDAFRKKFKPKKHCLVVSYTHYLPEEKFFTKSGNISRFSMDLSNIEKCLQDLIFDKRYRDRDGIPTLAIDDQFIVDMISKKRPSDSYLIEITIELHSLDYVRNL